MILTNNFVEYSQKLPTKLLGHSQRNSALSLEVKTAIPPFKHCNKVYIFMLIKNSYIVNISYESFSCFGKVINN